MKIHEMSATQLLAAMDAGKLSSVQATQACIDRIQAVDSTINAVPVRRFEAALQEAHKQDELRRSGAGGALCGLPMSIKENLNLTGFDSTMGLLNRRGQPATEDAVVVAALRAAGAVIVGKTNVPQLLLAQESENAIWGLTKNPWNLDRTPGGSSGGESAAIASGMVPCGVGTDIGGSIRIPAHFTGICGLKPTLDRWSNRGSQGAILGQELVRAQMGPMARTTADLTLMMNTLDPVAMANHDPRVPPLPFTDPSKIKVRGMRVGFYQDDGFLAPTRSIRRGVNQARKILEDAGVEVVPLVPPDRGEIVFLWLAGISGDGGATIMSKMGKEAPSRQLKPSRRLAGLPSMARNALAAVMERTGEKRVARLLRAIGEKSVKDYWDLVEERTHIRMREMDAWNAADVDAVLCPPHSVPAVRHGESSEFVLSLSYMFRYSMLALPAGVVPVTRVQEGEIDPTRTGDRVERQLTAVDVGSAGLPVGAQVVGRPFREDIVLALMSVIEAGARKIDGYPATPVNP